MTGKASILAVDDDASISELISSALSAEKYSVSVAYTGEEGVARFREGRFDLVIMDIQMPGMDGITALGEIKKISPDVEVVIATGHGTMGTAIQSLRKGAFDYLHKPFQISELLAVVERALEKKKFNDMTKAIFSTIRSEELLGIIIDSVTRMLKADESLLVLTDKAGTPYIANSYGLEEGARAESRLELCRRVLGRPPEKALRAATLLDEPANVPGLSDIPGTEDIKFALLLPVMEGERLSGLININRLSPEEHFTENDLQRAAIFGSLANLALRNASLYRQLQETQSQLVQAEKMSALGQLAGGLAHEINNPLSGILGLTQLVMEQTAPSTQNHSDLKEIEKAVFRCKKIITSLLSFARQDKFRPEPVNVHEALEETLTLCDRQMELKGIKMVKRFGEGLPTVNADFQQLMQVFLNLFNNARDSMPDGGTMTIATRLAPGAVPPRVEIEITDTGKGIPEDILSRVFDPFFTTKPPGQGTGLGLSVCLGIMNKHNGTITAVSLPGKGSSFVLTLPA